MPILYEKESLDIIKMVKDGDDKKAKEKIMSLMSKAEDWDKVVNKIHSDKNPSKSLYEEVSRELLDSQCFGLHIHIFEFLDRIFDKYAEKEDMVRSEIYNDIYFEEKEEIKKAIACMQRIVDGMKY